MFNVGNIWFDSGSVAPNFLEAWLSKSDSSAAYHKAYKPCVADVQAIADAHRALRAD